MVNALLALALLPHGHVVGVVRDGQRDATADLLHAVPQLRLDRIPGRRLRENFTAENSQLLNIRAQIFHDCQHT